MTRGVLCAAGAMSVALCAAIAYQLSHPVQAETGGPRPPARLAETGLYVGDRSDEVDPRNRSFAPQYPLWSDGMVKRRWVINCGVCHNGRGEIAALGPIIRTPDLLRDGDAVARAMIDAPTLWQIPGAADGASVLVSPGAPDRSALLARMRSRAPSSQMPPLGTVLRDQEAVDAIARWIASMNGARSGERPARPARGARAPVGSPP